MEIQILEGNVLETLMGLRDRSVQCVVTSPPYYGLRDYGTKPCIWGGDSTCAHEWNEHIQPAANGIIHDGGMSGETLSGRSATRNPKISAFCKKCGAWLGNYGLEPSPELYVEHTVTIFREVRRVMKDDGTLWLNLGDSYWGGKGQSSQAWSTEHQERDTLQKAQHQITGKGETRPTDGKHSVIKPKDLIGIPWMVAFALRADGWWLRSDIIWHKPNPMPESVRDRCTRSHEYLFLLTKSKAYYYDNKAIKEPAKEWGGRAATFERSGPVSEHVLPGQLKAQHRSDRAKSKNFDKSQGGGGNGFKGHSGNRMADGTLLIDRNKRDVWTVSTKPYREAHFATFPPDLIEPCVLAGSRTGDTVLDPFNGSGTTGEVSIKHGRNYIGCELNPDYVRMTKRRLQKLNFI